MSADVVHPGFTPPVPGYGTSMPIGISTYLVLVGLVLLRVLRGVWEVAGWAVLAVGGLAITAIVVHRVAHWAERQWPAMTGQVIGADAAGDGVWLLVVHEGDPWSAGGTAGDRPERTGASSASGRGSERSRCHRPRRLCCRPTYSAGGRRGVCPR